MLDASTSPRTSGGSDGAAAQEAGRLASAARAHSASRITKREIWVDLLMYPTHSLPTALAPILVGAGLALDDGVFAPLPLVVGFLGSWLIHVAGVFADNHELLRLHPRVEEHPELTRALHAGVLKLSTLRAAIAACLVLALLTAPYLYRVGGGPILLLGAIGIVVSLSYNAGPLAYVRRGAADPLFVVMFGVVGVAGAYYAQLAAHHGAPAPWQLLASLTLPVFVVGLPAGAIVTAVMLIDDLRDREFDAAKGWRTGAVRWGADFSRAEITTLVAFASVAPVLFWVALGYGAWVLLPLATAPWAWRLVRAVRSSRTRADLGPLSPRMAALALIHSALLAIGIAIQG